MPTTTRQRASKQHANCGRRLFEHSAKSFEPHTEESSDFVLGAFETSLLREQPRLQLLKLFI